MFVFVAYLYSIMNTNEKYIGHVIAKNMYDVCIVHIKNIYGGNIVMNKRVAMFTQNQSDNLVPNS